MRGLDEIRSEKTEVEIEEPLSRVSQSSCGSGIWWYAALERTVCFGGELEMAMTGGQGSWGQTGSTAHASRLYDRPHIDDTLPAPARPEGRLTLPFPLPFFSYLSNPPQEAALDDSLPYDAVIVGAGIQGILLLAEAVKHGYKRVIIVEKKPWCAERGWLRWACGWRLF